MNSTERLEVLLEPAFRDYLAAEAELTAALAKHDEPAASGARNAVLRTARAAASELHQFCDAVAIEAPDWLPAGCDTPRSVQAHVQSTYCRSLRGSPCADMDLLHDIQDAFKHVTLDDRPKNPRRVSDDGAIISMQSGYGSLPFGEGKFGGTEQMVVTLSDGSQRALSAIFQNVLDAWRLAMGRKLPDIGE